MSIIENIQTQIDEVKYWAEVFVGPKKFLIQLITIYILITTKKTRLLWDSGHC